MRVIDIENINYNMRNETRFVLKCEEIYHDKIQTAVSTLLNSIDSHPYVMLSGPSGSGKTTTALRIRDYLENLGDNELELEIVPDVSNTSSTTSSTSSAVTSGSTATTSSKPASSTSSAATSGSTTTTSSKPASSSSSSDDGWMPGIW